MAENSDANTGRKGPRRDARGRLSGGNPGNRGGGRLPNEFKDFLKRSIRDDPKARAALRKAAKNPESRGFSAAWKYATEYDEEKPAAKADVTSKGQQVSAVIVMPEEKQ